MMTWESASPDAVFAFAQTFDWLSAMVCPAMLVEKTASVVTRRLPAVGVMLAVVVPD
jgi:hypothetical protein